jgi:hypothetical protein
VAQPPAPLDPHRLDAQRRHRLVEQVVEVEGVAAAQVRLVPGEDFAQLARRAAQRTERGRVEAGGLGGGDGGLQRLD